MKTTLALAAILLSSCATTEQNARLSSIVNLALSVAERKGVITPADAQAVRDAETIVLTPTTVVTPTGK